MMIPSDVNVGLCEYEGMTDLEAAWSFKTRFFPVSCWSRCVHLLRLLLESTVVICFFQFFMLLSWSSEPELLVISFSSLKLVTSQIY